MSVEAARRPARMFTAASAADRSADVADGAVLSGSPQSPYPDLAETGDVFEYSDAITGAR